MHDDVGFGARPGLVNKNRWKRIVCWDQFHLAPYFSTTYFVRLQNKIVGKVELARV